MANTAVNLVIRTQGREGFKFHLPVDGGSHIYRGSLVSQLTASGCLVPLTTASAGQCVGVSQMQANNTAGSDGDLRCEVETDRLYEFTNGSDAFDEGDQIGAVVYASDDHTVENLSDSGARPAVGIYMGITSEGRVVVWVSPALAQRLAAIVALTVTALAGTASDVMEAIDDPADAPGTADALRDDLVANALPAIRNNLADLAAKVNALIARG